MRRLFWLALGVTLGVLVMRRLTRAAQALTPSGLAHSIGGSLAELSEAIRDFAADVRDGMAEHEAALREGAGLDAGDPSAPPPVAQRATGDTAGAASGRADAAGPAAAAPEPGRARHSSR